MDLGVGVVVGLQGLVAAAALGRHERQDHVDPHGSLGGGGDVDVSDLVNGRVGAMTRISS